MKKFRKNLRERGRFYRFISCASAFFLALFILSSCASSPSSQSASPSASPSEQAEPEWASQTPSGPHPGFTDTPGTDSDSASAPRTSGRYIPELTPRGSAEWTIMYYLCGTDLEEDYGLATSNLKEIRNTNPSDSVNFVIQTGGTPTWHGDPSLGMDLDPDFSQRWTYDRSGYTLVDELPVQNMSTPRTLTSFISWCAEYFPAEKYMLILWDHGGGSNMGLINDLIHGDIVMSVSELGSAIRESGVHFDIVAFDCCMMGSFETAEQLKDSADYMVASEEMVPGYGMAYTEWLTTLYRNPEIGARDLGARMVDAVFEKYSVVTRQLRSRNSENADILAAKITFSLIDLSEMDAVSAAFDGFWLEMASKIANPGRFAYLGYGGIRNTEMYGADPSYGMYDLRRFADGATLNGLSESVGNALLEAIDNAVVHERHAQSRPRATGLSFWYFPNAEPYTLDHYARQSRSAAYLAFLDSANFGWSAPDWVYEQVPQFPEVTRDKYVVDGYPDVDENGRITFIHTMGIEALVNIRYILEYVDEDGDIYRLGESSATDGDFQDGRFTIDFDGTWPAIDGNFLSLTIIEENFNADTVNIPVRVNGSEQVLRASYIYDTPLKGIPDEDRRGRYQVFGLWNGINSQTGLPGRDVRDIEELYGEEITFVLPRVEYTSGARIGGYRQEGTVTFSESTAAEPTLLPAGTYLIRFLLIDVLNNTTYSEPLILRLDGEGGITALPFGSPLP